VRPEEERADPMAPRGAEALTRGRDDRLLVLVGPPHDLHGRPTVSPRAGRSCHPGCHGRLMAAIVAWWAPPVAPESLAGAGP